MTEFKIDMLTEIPEQAAENLECVVADMPGIPTITEAVRRVVAVHQYYVKIGRQGLKMVAVLPEEDESIELPAFEGDDVEAAMASTRTLHISINNEVKVYLDRIGKRYDYRGVSWARFWWQSTGLYRDLVTRHNATDPPQEILVVNPLIPEERDLEFHLFGTPLRLVQ